MSNGRFLRRFNWGIAACACLIVALGLFFIYSSTYQFGVGSGDSYVIRQLIWALLGVFMAAIFAALDYRILAGAAYTLYGASLVPLIAVLLSSDPRRGAQSWFTISSFAIQPSEFAKIFTIMALARFLAREDARRASFSYIAGALLMTSVPLLLILAQPDLGTAVVMVPVLFAMLVAARANAIYLFFIAMAGVLTLPLGWFFLKPYQQARLRVFLNPHLDPLRSGYNAIQAMIAVGSGGVTGQGWLHGPQTQLRFLPERHTDFIFCVFAEETGFMGCVLLLSLYAVIIFGGLRIAGQARDEFGRLAAVGITVLIIAHVTINIGMTVGLLPVTGLPLPLMSYGGSSLISIFICIGILESIWARRYVF